MRFYETLFKIKRIHQGIAINLRSSCKVSYFCTIVTNINFDSRF
jgi:hypothetical protein